MWNQLIKQYIPGHPITTFVNGSNLPVSIASFAGFERYCDIFKPHFRDLIRIETLNPARLSSHPLQVEAM